jgi:hypothetical protein
MIKNDYILRLLEQFGRVLARLIGLTDAQQFREALSMLRDETGRLIGIDGTMLELLDAAALKRALPGPEKRVFAARALQEMSRIQQLDGEPFRSSANALKSLDLYASVLKSDRDALDGEVLEWARATAETINDQDATSDERLDLVTNFEIVGMFNRAEDLLFSLLEEGFESDQVVEAGTAFYDRIAKLSDEELANGGLPRNEIADGRRALNTQQ